MCDVPFFPIFPICFQCGTDQNPCHCKVVGPTLGMCPVGMLIGELTSPGFCATVVSAVSDQILHDADLPWLIGILPGLLLASVDLLWMWLH